MSVRKADKPLVESILNSLETNDVAVEKAIFLLGQLQTDEELSQQATLKHNSVGFSTAHARFGAYAYGVILSGRHLSPKMMTQARYIVKQYARTQLLNIAKEKLKRRAQHEH